MLVDPRARLVDGPAGALETLFQEAERPGPFAAVVAHPHPLHGGTMFNKVVHRAAKALRVAGVATLRFNFRGVGRSGGRHDDGRGEQDDFRVVLDELERQCPGRSILAAGFSFGSRIALTVGEGDPRVHALIGLGLPLTLYPDLPALLARIGKPLLLLQGVRDQFTSAKDLRHALQDLPRPPVIFDVPGDHFFDVGLDRLDETIPWFVNRLENQVDSIDQRDPRLA